jgi:glycosyltransferase involved in cell wall biosynthesis
MNLGCLPPLGGGIKDLVETGQQGRLFDYYFRHYLCRFKKVYYFSCIDEALRDYTESADLLERVVLIGNEGPFGRKIYAMSMAIQQRLQIKECSILRVYQAIGALPAIMAKYFYGIPFVVTFGYRHSHLARQLGLSPWKIVIYIGLERLAMRFADGIIVTTEELKSYVSQFAPIKKIHFIPNGVDTRLFGPKRATSRTKQVATIVFVGRLEKQKDLPTLLRALVLLKSEGHELRLQIVGDGTLLSWLKRQTTETGIETNYLGVIPHQFLPDVLHKADVFVLPSILEGHPKVLIEAMSCGLACVVSNCEGNRSLVIDGVNGLVFPIGEVQALAEQLRRVLINHGFAAGLGKAARQQTVDHFDINILLDKEIDLLTTVASQARG